MSEERNSGDSGGGIGCFWFIVIAMLWHTTCQQADRIDALERAAQGQHQGARR